MPRVEDKYVKLDPKQHVLKRPDMYAGSIENGPRVALILNSDNKIEEKNITFNPGLFKLADETLVNAWDHWQNTQSTSSRVRNIKIDISIDDGFISIENDGSGIPIEWHSEQKMYVPEMIFGNLLTSSNYDDTKPRTTGGKNGLGSKIANIFSTKFIVDTVDQGKTYKQTFENNMTIVNPPEISKTKSKPTGTGIKFYPDLQRFGLTEFSEDFVSFLRMRAYEVSACTDSSVVIYFNGSKVPCKNFEDFVKVFEVK